MVRAVDLLCLTETWQDADCAVLGCLCGAAYNVVDRARPRTADDLSVNHDSVTLSSVSISRCRRLTLPIIRPLEIVRARARVGCFAAIVVRALNLTLRSCIISYRIVSRYFV